MSNGVSVDLMRLEANQKLDPGRKSELGQFMTPSRVAQYMASLFSPGNFDAIRLLDAGAGIGSLTAAFLERLLAAELIASATEVTAYEIDSQLRGYLENLLETYIERARTAGLSLTSEIVAYDFIEDATDRIIFWNTQAFTHAILNPPYKKIHSDSQHRKSLRAVGIETVNLYSAFLGLAVRLMADGGEIVAIIPRSFCNGPYYQSFREALLTETAINHIHLFAARDKAFGGDDVLQENVIIHLVKQGVQETVTVSTSTDQTFEDYFIYEYPFEQIVQTDDPARFIRIPTTPEQNIIERSPFVRCSLQDLALEVSTGPVVDFRVKEYLRDQPEAGTAPLLYPGHFTHDLIAWPKLGMKKPNALKVCPETTKWFYPNGFYTVVKRFSSKEEKRRIVANVVNPHIFESKQLGFENHLNVFHQGKRGLPEELAYGLTLFLNSSLVDDYFRQFNGHTQVNATDLRLMKYPSLEILIEFGQWAKIRHHAPSQVEIDEKVASIVWPSIHAF